MKALGKARRRAPSPALGIKKDRYGLLPGEQPTIEQIIRAGKWIQEETGQYPTAASGTDRAPGGHEWGALLKRLKAETGYTLEGCIRKDYLYRGVLERMQAGGGENGTPNGTGKKRSPKNISLSLTEIREAIRLHVRAEKKPPSSADGAIKYGELAQKGLTWSAINTRLKKATVDGITEESSLTALKQDMGLVSETGRTAKLTIKPLSASEVFNAVALFVQNNKTLPQADTTRPLLGRTTTYTVGLAFQRGVVTDLEQIIDIDEDDGPPVCLQEFLVAAGFAELDDYSRPVMVADPPEPLAA